MAGTAVSVLQKPFTKPSRSAQPPRAQSSYDAHIDKKKQLYEAALRAREANPEQWDAIQANLARQLAQLNA